MDNLKRRYISIFNISYSPIPGYLAAGNNYGTICIFYIQVKKPNFSDIYSSQEEKDLFSKSENVPDKMDPGDTANFKEMFKNLVGGASAADFTIPPIKRAKFNDMLNDAVYIDVKQFEKPVFKFTAHKSQVYSLVSTKELLISGSSGEICAWQWEDIVCKTEKCVWCFKIPDQSNCCIPPEVNCLVLCPSDENVVYAGVGDNNIYGCDVESGTLLFTLSGHTNYIHCLKVLNDSKTCISGSEDGTVKMWDPRKNNEVAATIIPHEHEKVYRRQFNKWIGCVDVDDSNEWMICGGGPALALWDLRTLLPTTVYDKPTAQTHVALFHDDIILSGGSEPIVNHWSLNGDLLAEVPTSTIAVFDLKISSCVNPMLCVAGCGRKLDIFKNFRVKAFSLYTDL